MRAPLFRIVWIFVGLASLGGLADLPLIEVPPPAGQGGDTLALLLTGDGGWAKADVELSAALARRGIPVVGWSSPRAFLHQRSPESAAADLTAILRYYLPAWKRKRVVLIGYSFGADVVPFLARRLPPDLTAALSLVALLSPSRETDFQFHPLDLLLHGRHHPGERPVRPEIEALHGTPILCVTGKEEEDSLCRELPASLALHLTHPGGHILRQGAEGVAEEIVRALRGGSTR